MIVGDATLRKYLRDLPTGYLLDLLAEEQGVDATLIRQVLLERGMEAGEITRHVNLRTASRLPRVYQFWKAARLFTLVCTVLVTAFNLIAYYRLLHDGSPFKALLLALSVGGAGFGFFLGYKLSTHIYQGAPHQLHCGFPLPVGYVDLKNCQEIVKSKPLLLLCMVANATVGLTLVLFPLLLIHYLLH